MAHIEKTLANCKPTEFLAQANKVRKSVERWLTATDILNIRKHTPKIEPTATKEEKDAAIQAQVKRNLSDILDAMLEAHPAETLELLALLCFVDPKRVDDYPIAEYLGAFADMLNDRAVMGFFTSLVKLGQTFTST